MHEGGRTLDGQDIDGRPFGNDDAEVGGERTRGPLLATAAHVRRDWAWLLPAAVDGAMAVGTVAVVVLRRLGHATTYPWAVVLVNAGISIGCNALHAAMGGALVLPQVIAMAVSAIPAINLALSVHLLVALVDGLVTTVQGSATSQVDSEPANARSYAAPDLTSHDPVVSDGHGAPASSSVSSYDLQRDTAGSNRGTPKPPQTSSIIPQGASDVTSDDSSGYATKNTNGSYASHMSPARESAAPDEAHMTLELSPDGSYDAHTPHEAGRIRDADTGQTGGAERADRLDRAVSRSRRSASVRQREAWQWALANRSSTGVLPSGKAIAERFERRERWGRLVKQAGLAGRLKPTAVQE